MSRLAIETPGQAQTVLSCLYRDMGRCIIASQPGLCPVDMSLNFLRLCHAQTCGKCVPCRIGLGQLAVLIEQVLDRTATLETVDLRQLKSTGTADLFKRDSVILLISLLTILFFHVDNDRVGHRFISPHNLKMTMCKINQCFLKHRVFLPNSAYRTAPVF